MQRGRDTAVEESNLSVQIASLRKLLGPSPGWRRVDRDHPAGRLSLRRRRGSDRPAPRRRPPLGAGHSLARGAAVPEPERRPRAGLFRRRRGRGHHHGAEPLQILRGDRAQFVLRLQGPRRRRAAGGEGPRRPLRARRQRAARRRPAADHRRSWSTASPARISGPRISMARSRTCSTSRTGSPRASRRWSSRISRRRRSSARGVSGREASRPTTSTCRRCPSIYSETAEQNRDAFDSCHRSARARAGQPVILAPCRLGARAIGARWAGRRSGPTTGRNASSWRARGLDTRAGDATVMALCGMSLIHTAQGLRLGDGRHPVGGGGQPQQPDRSSSRRASRTFIAGTSRMRSPISIGRSG